MSAGNGCIIYVYLKFFDYGSAASMFWSRSATVKGHILQISWRCEFNVLISAVDSFMDKVY